ncbi:aromatic amino acid lyase [Pikeienuella piscinae]|uniref:Aromatic amino acid lyase n=1 Tax=Pikeienuella piscinae TaxID=2748098 RepID=A0A7M3T686_9RHOB|nr:aromatic amino acid lyase [Pikeienuella piscinae]QIE57517.1 aromatic amino acid lyase [Pikeienuella piscinae]
MTVTLRNRKDLTLDAARRVGLGGEGVAIGPEAVTAMNRARESFMRYLDADRTRFVYGVTSGAGQNAKTPVPPDQQRARAAENRRTFNGAGFGPEAVPERAVRMIILARLANYVEGNAKTRPVEAERIASMLDAPIPRLPLTGQLGAGEILPLFHIMSAMPDGEVEEAEPMARINGSPVSAGLAADAALTARGRLKLATAIMALSVEGYGAPLAPYDAGLGRRIADPHERAALTALRAWLEDAPTAGRIDYQAPVSWRILPTVLGAAEAAVATLEEVAEISLSSVTDNPVYVLPDESHPDGRVMSTGGYHNAAATPAVDAVNARQADLCTLADRQTMKLFSAEHLPAGLVDPNGPPYGAGVISFVQIGFGEEARHAARRTFMPPSEGGGIGGQNDVATTAAFSYAKNLRSSFCLEASLAVLAAAASQALWVTKREPAPALRPFLDEIRAHVAPVTDRRERDLGADLHALQTRFATLAITGGPNPHSHSR